MIIDFSYTSQNNQAEIEFYNVRGQIVKTYPLAELEKWVYLNGLNLTRVSVNGRITSDPNILEKEIEVDLDDYIDRNWRTVTERFYMDKNPAEFISNNKPQQLRS